MLVVTMLSIPTTFAERTLYCNEQGIGELRDDGELANLGEDAFILDESVFSQICEFSVVSESVSYTHLTLPTILRV